MHVSTRVPSVDSQNTVPFGVRAGGADGKYLGTDE